MTLASLTELIELLPYLTPQENDAINQLLILIPETTAWSYIEPHAAQQQIVQSRARYRVLACGRRFGKTELAIQQLGNSALASHLSYAYFAPTYKMLADVWRSFKTALVDRTLNKNEQEKRLELVGDGSIDFWSLDNPNAARGRKYAGIVVDEAAWVTDLEYAWTFVLQPTLTDFSGWAWFLSTPNGRNYFFHLWSLGQSQKANWQSWQFPTLANPYIKPSEIDEKRDMLPERAYRQEYEAEFIEDGGAVFRNISAALTAPKPAANHAGHDVIIGADWGKSNDYTVFTAICRACHQMLDFDRMNTVDYALQVGRLQQFAGQWSKTTIYPEENSMGVPIIEQLERLGLTVRPFLTTASSKPPLIESLALAIERGELALQDEPVMVGELQAYTMTLNKVTGRPTYSAPEGLHDDCVMSLALAWHGVNQPRGVDLVGFV